MIKKNPRFIAVGAATVAMAVSMAGCSSSTGASDRWSDELTAAGFTDVAVVSDDGGNRIAPNSLQATAEGCRLHFVATVASGDTRLYVAVPGTERDEEPVYIADPSLSMLKQDERFAACFTGTDTAPTE